MSIRTAVNDFEAALLALIESVSQFRSPDDAADRLIQAEYALRTATEELKHHQQAQVTISQLELEAQQLGQQLNDVLVELADCRRLLRAPPNMDLEALRRHNRTHTRVSAKLLLQYATRITKFTHAPPEYTQGVSDHANYPWPVEDEMQKGVLALAALLDNSKTEADAPTQPQASRPPPTRSTRTTRRRSSVVSYGERPIVNPSAEPSRAVVDLDLFDPDDDDDE